MTSAQIVLVGGGVRLAALTYSHQFRDFGATGTRLPIDLDRISHGRGLRFVSLGYIGPQRSRGSVEPRCNIAKLMFRPATGKPPFCPRRFE